MSVTVNKQRQVTSFSYIYLSLTQFTGKIRALYLFTLKSKKEDDWNKGEMLNSGIGK